MGGRAYLSLATMGRDFLKGHFELRQRKTFVLRVLNVRELGLARFSSTNPVSVLSYFKDIGVSHLS